MNENTMSRPFDTLVTMCTHRRRSRPPWYRCRTWRPWGPCPRCWCRCWGSDRASGGCGPRDQCTGDGQPAGGRPSRSAGDQGGRTSLLGPGQAGDDAAPSQPPESNHHSQITSVKSPHRQWFKTACSARNRSMWWAWADSNLRRTCQHCPTICRPENHQLHILYLHCAVIISVYSTTSLSASVMDILPRHRRHPSRNWPGRHRCWRCSWRRCWSAVLWCWSGSPGIAWRPRSRPVRSARSKSQCLQEIRVRYDVFHMWS